MAKAELKHGKSFLKLGENLFKLRGTYNSIKIGTEEIVLLSLINNLSNTKPCSASNSYLSSYLNIKVDTLRKQFKKLKDAGFIKTFQTRRKGCKETTERIVYIQTEYLNKLMEADAYSKASSIQQVLINLSHRTGIVFPREWEQIPKGKVTYCLSKGKHFPPNKIKNTIKKDNYKKKKSEEGEIPLTLEEKIEEDSSNNSVFDPVTDSEESLEAVASNYNYDNASLKKYRAFSSLNADALTTEEVPYSSDNDVSDAVKDYDYPNYELEHQQAFDSIIANTVKIKEDFDSSDNSVFNSVVDSNESPAEKIYKSNSIDWIKPLFDLINIRKEN